jgi:hypothetical protein
MLFVSLNGKSQELQRYSISCYGSSFQSPQLYIAQTIGQSIPTLTTNNSSLFLHPGFEQGLSPTVSNNGNGLTLTVFPNPSTGNFVVYSNLLENEYYSYDLFSMDGKIIVHGIQTNTTPLFLQLIGLAAGNYNLRIQSNAGSIGNAKLSIF